MDTRSRKILKLAVMICTCFLSFILLIILAGRPSSRVLGMIFWGVLYTIAFIIGVNVLIIQPLIQIFKTPKEDRYRLFSNDISFNFKSTLILNFIYTAIVIIPFIKALQGLDFSVQLTILGIIFPFPFFVAFIAGMGISILSAFSLISIISGFFPLSVNLAVTLFQFKICKKISSVKAIILGLLVFVPFLSLIINIICVVKSSKEREETHNFHI